MAEVREGPISARRVRVTVDVKSGTASVTLTRDGAIVQKSSIRATTGIELSYLYPPTGLDPQPHTYILTVVGNAVVIIGGGLESEAKIILQEDTTEGEMPEPEMN